MSGSLFTSDTQRSLFREVLSALDRIGYGDDLVRRNYRFPDWFALKPGDQSHLPPRKTIDAAVFGRLPEAYETALIGVAIANGESGPALATANRSLGAPLIVGIEDGDISVWAVGRRTADPFRVARTSGDGFRAWVEEHHESLAPTEFLRTKNLGTARPTFIQRTLFAGQIPELEDQIGGILEPRLIRAFDAGWQTYERTAGHPPHERRLFQAAFWLLTGKVFADRGHSKFDDLRNPAMIDPDDVLRRVAKHYRREPQANLLNRETREAICRRIWSQMDFQNVSVEVLSQLWSTALVTPETRKRLGIHRTRRSVVRYIIDRIPFEDFEPKERRVFEPCSGSAGFLVAAMDRMHDLRPDAESDYFQKRLAGFERDSFGVEISRLCLSLADYPNPNKWNITRGDVFRPNVLANELARARIVLCNPPFEKFEEDERRKYRATHFLKAAELLSRVLDHLHPRGVIGFVLPRTFLDGQDFRDVRTRLVKRFGEIDLLRLPDKGWDFASKETVLLTATKPRAGDRSKVTQGIVRERGWLAFDWHQMVASRDTDERTADEARGSLAVPELRDVWEYLEYCPKLGAIAEAHKGIEWKIPLTKTNEAKLVRHDPFPESRLGVPPRAKFDSFETPPKDQLRYLSFAKETRRREAFDRPWDLPNVIMNKTARSRWMWRVSAFANFDGLACFETFFAVWLRDRKQIADRRRTLALAAVLNGPVANAFLTVHRGKLEFTIKALHNVPYPVFSEAQLTELGRLVPAYVASLPRDVLIPDQAFDESERLLRQIDAVVLEAYSLPPRLERKLLDFFNGSDRQVPFAFGDYYPPEFTPAFSLRDTLTGRHSRATVGTFRRMGRDIPAEYQQAMARASEHAEEAVE